MEPAVVVDDIHKAYGNQPALSGLSLQVEKGELFGLIGPDGAGKTTLIRILTTLLYPDKGNAFVFGNNTVRDFKKIRHLAGYMPGRFSLYQDLSVEENLAFYASIFGTTVKENYDLIKDIYQQIEPFKKRLAGELSGGMKQKLALSCALIHKPQILFLDEPTYGVDAVSRKEFWEMLKNLKRAGITILVSTAYMDEAAQCETVALLQKGVLLDVNTPDKIRANYNHPLYEVESENMHRLVKDLRQYPATRTAFAFGATIHLSTHREVDKERLKSFLDGKGHRQVTVSPAQPNIEDCFMNLMYKNND